MSISLSSIGIDGDIRITNTDNGSDVKDVKISLGDKNSISISSGFTDLLFFKLPNGYVKGGVTHSTHSLVDGIIQNHIANTLTGSGTISASSSNTGHDAWYAVDGNTSTYWESSIIRLIEAHTSETSTSGTIAVSSVDDNGGSGGYEGWKIVDGDIATYWKTPDATVSGIVTYTLTAPKKVSYFEITCPDAANAPKDFSIEGSNNGTDWTSVATALTDEVFVNNDKKMYNCISDTAYSQYRLNITSATTGATSIKIGEFQIISSGINASLVYHFESGKVAKNIYITCPDAANAPKDFSIEGSNNGTDWTGIGAAVSNAIFTNDTAVKYDITMNATSYAYYRLNITNNTQNGSSIKISVFKIDIDNTVIDNMGFYVRFIPMKYNGTNAIVEDTAQIVTTDFIALDKYESETQFFFEGKCSYNSTSALLDAYYTNIEVYFKTAAPESQNLLLFTSTALSRSASFSSLIHSGLTQKGIHVVTGDSNDNLFMEVSFKFVLTK